MIGMRFYPAGSKMLGLAHENISDVVNRINQSDISKKDVINVETVIEGKKFKGIRVWYKN